MKKVCLTVFVVLSFFTFTNSEKFVFAEEIQTNDIEDSIVTEEDIILSRILLREQKHSNGVMLVVLKQEIQ